MNYKEHRIYQYMSEPIRIFGLTMDEFAVVGICVLGTMVAHSLINKSFFVLVGTLGLYSLKKFKKLVLGFSLYSFLHWKLGIRFKLPKNWPESWKRIWLP
jgi:type IV conjugative transfer system protein TraL